jgi:hypothetical protein
VDRIVEWEVPRAVLRALRKRRSKRRKRSKRREEKKLP